MELTNTTIVKSVNARDGVRVFFRHEDAEGNIYMALTSYTDLHSQAYMMC